MIKSGEVFAIYNVYGNITSLQLRHESSETRSLIMGCRIQQTQLNKLVCVWFGNFMGWVGSIPWFLCWSEPFFSLVVWVGFTTTCLVWSWDEVPYNWGPPIVIYFSFFLLVLSSPHATNQ